MKKDPTRLRAALIGYLSELDEVDRAIAEIRRRLGLKGGSSRDGSRNLRKSRGTRKKS